MSMVVVYRYTNQLKIGDRFWDPNTNREVVVRVHQIEVAPRGCPHKVHINESLCYDVMKVCLA